MTAALKSPLPDTIPCEQIYNLWLSDPDLIRVLDLRPAADYQAGHIPGAINVRPDQVRSVILGLGDKLAVLYLPRREDRLSLVTELGALENFVFMDECEKWKTLNHPLAGDDIQLQIHGLPALKGDFMSRDIIFQQLFEPETSTYTYLIADRATKEAAIIDPVLETLDRDLKLIEELGLKLLYVLDTHVHADHITGAAILRERLGAKTAASRVAGVQGIDIELEDGQELLLGDRKIRVISTPGHTDSCVTYAFEGMIFTGDTLLIRGCGRTDFQQGSPAKLYHSVHEKLFRLPDETIIYPGHDYRGLTSSSIGAEKKFNPRLRQDMTLEDFVRVMNELNLPRPKKIDEAVPANMAGGRPRADRVFHPQNVDGIPEVSPDDVFAHREAAKSGRVLLIDVRRPEEFNNELGHVEGATLVTLGPELTAFLESGDRAQEIVFICRSGGRSGTATGESQRLGYTKTINMTGGMLRWNERKLPTE